jgi:hypothetical protein
MLLFLSWLNSRSVLFFDVYRYLFFFRAELFSFSASDATRVPRAVRQPMHSNDAPRKLADCQTTRQAVLSLWGETLPAFLTVVQQPAAPLPSSESPRQGFTPYAKSIFRGRMPFLRETTTEQPKATR